MSNPRPHHLLGAAFVVVIVGLGGLAFSDGATPAASCDDVEGVEASVSFANDVQMVFDFNCVACHQTGAANAGLNLEFGLAYENLVGVDSTQSDLALVAAGDPEGSYLLHKLRNTQADVGGSGGIMPLGLGGLPEREIEAITTWILECALDN